MAHPNLKDDPFPMGGDHDNVRNWFELRLDRRAPTEAHLLAGRAAMRCLPQLIEVLQNTKRRAPKTPESVLISFLRCYPISLSPALVIASEIEQLISAANLAELDAEVNIASADEHKKNAAYSASYSAAYSAYAVSVKSHGSSATALVPAFTARAATYGSEAIYIAYASTAAYAAYAAAFEQDCRAAEHSNLKQLARLPLWPWLDAEVSKAFPEHSLSKTHKNGVPLELAAAWSKMSNALLTLPDDFAVWAEWYQGMLDGEQNGRYLFGLPTERALRLNVDIALIDDELWKDPAKANAEIRRLVDYKGPVPAEVPAQKPAALEPLYIDGRLVLPGGPLWHDSKPDNLIGALKALRLDFEELATDCDGVANISEADVKSLGWVARRIPEAEPTSLELHRVAHLEKALEAFGGKVSEQWPDFLAARYHALSLQFGSVVNQFPNWRDFKRVANSDKLSAEQLNEAQKVVALANDILRPFPEAISADIPDQLQELAKPLFTAGEAPAFDSISAGMDLLAEDVLESFNNVLKRIAQGALAFRFGAEKIAGKGWTGFVKGTEKGVEEAAEKAGKRFGKVLVATLVGTPLVTGATWLWTTFPDKFGWLKRIIDLLI